jgi:KDO2-lipid IV(A) lauroyltransferase
VAGRKRKAFRHAALHRALLILSFTARRLPLPVGRWLGRGLGSLAWVVVPRERGKARRTIALAYPDLSASARDTILRKMFRHLGETLFEVLWLPNLDAKAFERTTTWEGADPVHRLLEQGRGVIIVTGHCGNWEWLAAAVAMLGFPLAVLQRERDEPEMNRFITSVRGHFGIRTIDRGSTGAGRQLIQAVRRGSLLGFLIDQNIRAESAKVPFFGIPALTPIGPAKLAIRTEAAVVPIFIQRRDGKQHVRFLEPLEAHRDDDPIALTARLTADIEAQIRRAPEQWVWMHERWRERPEFEVAPDGTKKH